MRGLENGCGPNGPRVLSAAVTPRGGRRGRPRPFALKWGAPGWLIPKRRGCGGTAGSHRPRRLQSAAAVPLHPAGARVPSFLPALVYHPVTTPPLFIFTAPSPAPPCCAIHSSTPPGPALLTAVLLQPLRPWGCSEAPTVHARPGSPPFPAQTGGEGREDYPPALRSRAPSRMGVAWP